MVALGLVGALVVLIAAGVGLGADGAGRIIGLLVAVIALVATVAALRALRRQAIVVEPHRIGRRNGWTGRITWCELADVRLTTLSEYRVLLGGTERNLILWTLRGGSTGLVAALAGVGLPANDRAAVAEAKAAHPGLRPFVVPLSGMRDEHAQRVLAFARLAP